MLWLAHPVAFLSRLSLRRLFSYTGKMLFFGRSAPKCLAVV
jgi:hypothetical protein